MKFVCFAAITFLAAFVLSSTAGAQEQKSRIVDEAKGKNCRIEQQCHWVNFKKICTYVKVCR